MDRAVAEKEGTKEANFCTDGEREAETGRRDAARENGRVFIRYGRRVVEGLREDRICTVYCGECSAFKVGASAKFVLSLSFTFILLFSIFLAVFLFCPRCQVINITVAHHIPLKLILITSYSFNMEKECITMEPSYIGSIVEKRTTEIQNVSYIERQIREFSINLQKGCPQSLIRSARIAENRETLKI